VDAAQNFGEGERVGRVTDDLGDDLGEGLGAGGFGHEGSLPVQKTPAVGVLDAVVVGRTLRQLGQPHLMQLVEQRLAEGLGVVERRITVVESRVGEFTIWMLGVATPHYFR
jgi:hypothetical protein